MKRSSRLHANPVRMARGTSPWLTWRTAFIARVHHIELHPPRLIPVEGDLVALPRNLREEERRQAAKLLERYARLTAGRNGHGWSSPGCSVHSRQRARVHRPTPRRRAELRAPPGTRLLALALGLALLATRLVGRRRRDPLRDLVRAPARCLAPLDVLVLPLALCAFHTAWWHARTSPNFVSLRRHARKIRTTWPLRRYAWVA